MCKSLKNELEGSDRRVKEAISGRLVRGDFYPEGEGKKLQNFEQKNGKV